MRIIWLVPTLLAAGLAAMSVSVSAEEGVPRMSREHGQEIPPGKAQSGATAADEARIYMAQLRRCEGFSGAQREACVEMARKRLGQL